MKRTTYRKRRPILYCMVKVEVFERHEEEKDRKETKLERLIEIQLNKHGWEKHGHITLDEMM